MMHMFVPAGFLIALVLVWIFFGGDWALGLLAIGLVIAFPSLFWIALAIGILMLGFYVASLPRTPHARPAPKTKEELERMRAADNAYWKKYIAVAGTVVGSFLTLILLAALAAASVA